MKRGRDVGAGGGRRGDLLADVRSFAAPRAVTTDPRGPGRVAVIDVGSNSVRLVVFDGIARSPAQFFNEKVLCGLGKGLAATGRLNAEGRQRAVETLRRFAGLAERMQVTALEAIATAAVREAADGAAFVEEVERETGLKVRIATGDDEARISAQGVLLGWPGAEGLVVDMGGASMELARIGGDRVGERVTTPLGPLQIRDRGLSGEALRAHLDRAILTARQSLPGPVPSLFLVGGSWRALGRVHMARAGYPLAVLHEYRMEPARLREEAAWIARQTPEALDALADVSAARAEVLPLAASVLDRLIALLAPASVAISGYGLREGLLWEHLSPAIRAQDPLIESCRFLEGKDARFPGFGAELFGFAAPLLDDFTPAERRLAEAACLLHDVNWRVHPDYRPDMGLETMTRASMAGIDHAGRVFIGLVLYHRYRSGRGALPPRAPLALLDAGAIAKAERLGRILRLGAMLSGSAPGGLDGAGLAVRGGELLLTLAPGLVDLWGEVVEKRLAALARGMDLGPRVAFAT